MIRARAVTFDFGQTLAEIDSDLLARRCAERGVAADARALNAAVPKAWAAYDAAIVSGQGGHPWRTLMRATLEFGGVTTPRLDDLVEWLWTEQPKKNLWRCPIAGMFELARALHAAQVPIAILSNSEGRLLELVAEVGLDDVFRIVVDSGRLGIEKPDPRIFAHTLGLLGAASNETVHIGDSFPADVEGALGAGLSAIWFRPRSEAPIDAERTRIARDADGVASALRSFGVEF